MKIRRDVVVSVLAVVLGLAIAWLTSQSAWVDAGTSLALSMLAAGGLAARGLRPRAAALSVSTPVVLLALLLNRPESVVALPGALIGAFLGAVFRRIMRWGPQPPPAN